LLLYPYWGPQPVVTAPLLGATVCCYCTIIGGHSLLLLYPYWGYSLLLLCPYWGPQPVVTVPLLGPTACCYCTLTGGHSLLLLYHYWGPQHVVTLPLLGATACCFNKKYFFCFKKNGNGYHFPFLFLKTAGVLSWMLKPPFQIWLDQRFPVCGMRNIGFVQVVFGTSTWIVVQTGPGAQPASCTMGTGSFPRVKSGRGVTLTTYPLLVPWSRKGRSIPLPPRPPSGPYGLYKACTMVHFTLLYMDCVYMTILIFNCFTDFVFILVP